MESNFMIDIVFSDSACGSLKIAQHYGEGKYRGGVFSVFISHEDGREPTEEEIESAKRKVEEKERLAWEKAIPLGGNPKDVFGFGLVLSIGDISENQLGDKRIHTLERLYGNFPNIDVHQTVREIIERANEDLKTVRERASAGESLRIWYSSNPDEMCGLYWFMGLLEQWNVDSGQVFIVKFPEWEALEEGNIVRKSCWGEVTPGEWHRYLNLQKPVLPLFIEDCASHWQELKRENSPLRAVLNGQLVSVSESIYDDFILREIAAETDEFYEAKIIGRVLGKYQLGISDSWVALRIEEMIHAGKLEVVAAAAKDMPTYHRVLKKSI